MMDKDLEFQEQERKMERAVEEYLAEGKEEYQRELEEKERKQKEKTVQILKTGSERDKALLRELVWNVQDLQQIREMVQQGRFTDIKEFEKAFDKEQWHKEKDWFAPHCLPENPVQPGSDYTGMIDGEIGLTRDEETRALFRDLQEEARQLRHELKIALIPWFHG